MFPLLLAATTAAATPVAPLQLETRILAERSQTAPDGTTRVVLGPPRRVAPGDPVVVQVSYRNAGAAPIVGLVVANPIPAGLTYRGPRTGPVPEVSIDGRTFGAIGALRIAGRPARASDVTHIRWRVPAPVPAGGGGTFAFQAAVQ